MSSDGARRARMTGVLVAVVGLTTLAGSAVAGASAPRHHSHAANGRIAYSIGEILPDTNLQARSQVYSVRPDGTGRRQLTHVAKPAEAGDPAWSPNGRRIAYVSNVSGTFQVWIMNANGRKQHVLVKDPDHDAFFPRWSPDGHRLLFTRCMRTLGILECAIATVHANGTGVRNQTGGHWTEQMADWSPGGHTIVFAGNHNGFESAIWRLTPTSGKIHRLTRPSVEAYYPSYRHDGRRILFGNNWDRPHTRTYSMRPNGRHVHLVRGGPKGSNVDFARYSPDDSKIVFDQEAQNGHAALRVANANGSRARTIASGRTLVIADWGPRR